MSNPKHPIITFQVTDAPDLIHYLHPDRHQTDQDLAQTQAAQHANLRTTYIPGFLAGENIVKNLNGTFTAYGMKAKYIKDTYATGASAILTVVSETFESE